MPRELTQAVVEQWVALTDGTFSNKDAWAELSIESPEGRHHLRVILGRMKKAGIIAATSKDSTYRRVDKEVEVIDWQSADTGNVVPLKFPFELEKYAKIYPKSIIIVAGEKNAGKTMFMYEFIKLNMLDFKIDLFNSETGPEQMKERFEPLDIPVPAPFTVYERYDNFADVINPNHISVIDYMDTQSEVYLVGTEIEAVFQKLKSVAVIGLQKPPPTKTLVRGVEKLIGRDLAYGGGFTAKRAVLYISLSRGRLKLVYVKTPANPKVHPDNMAWTFDISDDGSHFINIQQDYGDMFDD